MTIEYTKNYHHLTRIAAFCALLYCNSAFCAELVEYDHTFLMGQNASNIDLSRYSEGICAGCIYQTGDLGDIFLWIVWYSTLCYERRDCDREFE